MPLYITNFPLSSLINYIQTEVGVSFEELDIVSFEPGDEEGLKERLRKGSPIEPYLFAARWEGPPPEEFRLSTFCQAYLSVPSLTSWKSVKAKILELKEGIEILEQTVGKDEQGPITLAQYMFEPSAYQYFRAKFGKFHDKMAMETHRLLIKRTAQCHALTTNQLKQDYETNTSSFLHFLRSCIGTPEGTQFLSKQTESDIYPLVVGVGGKPPLIYSFVESWPYLYSRLALLENRILEGGCSPKWMTVLFHQWWVMSGISSPPTLENDKQLEDLLYGTLQEWG